MGIYIKDIALPELPDCSKNNNVPEVYNLHGAIVVYPDGKVELKSYTGRFEGTYDVISVPPHVRLIDADALRVRMIEVLYAHVARMIEVLNYAPTIIPAEGEEDDEEIAK